MDLWDDRNLFLGSLKFFLELEIDRKVFYLHRAPTSRYEDESPPPQARNTGKQQKPAGGGHGYGDYDYLYKNAPVCFRKQNHNHDVTSHIRVLMIYREEQDSRQQCQNLSYAMFVDANMERNRLKYMNHNV